MSNRLVPGPDYTSPEERALEVITKFDNGMTLPQREIFQETTESNCAVERKACSAVALAQLRSRLPQGKWRGVVASGQSDI
jgi:hypothetical protein